MPLRDPTAEELDQLIEQGVVLNKQGVGAIERWLVKNLAANPEEAANFLKRRGYEVGQVSGGNKLQMIVRKQGDQQYRLLDPQGTEILQDIGDLTSDIVGGAVTAATAAGGALSLSGAGPPGIAAGAVLGGRIGSGGFEAIRQTAGKLAGVNVSPDVRALQEAEEAGTISAPLGQATSMIGGAAIKGGLSVGKQVNKTAAKLSRNILGRVAGVSEEEFSRATSTAQRAKVITSESAPKVIEILDRVRAFIGNQQAEKSVEYRQAQNLLKKSRPVPLKGLFRVLLQPYSPIGEERPAIESARKIAVDIANKFGATSTIEARRLRITAAQAEELKRTLQNQIDFSGRPGEKLLNKLLKEAQGNLRTRIIASLPTSQARRQYQKLYGSAPELTPEGVVKPPSGVIGKMDVINKLNEKIGEFKKSGSEGFLRNLFNAGKSEERRLFKDLDDLYGTKFLDELDTAVVAEKFSKDAPRLTATGQFLGAGAGATAGGTAGAALGGPIGAAVGIPVGFAAGFSAASPKGAVKLGRGVARVEEGVKSFIRSGGRAVEAASPVAEPTTRYGVTTLARSAMPEKESYSISIEGDDETANNLRSIVNEINMMNLSPQDKFAEFEKRAAPLIKKTYE